MFNDLTYFSSLLISVALGTCYKKIENPEMKRNYGTGLGILLACLICGHHVYHSVFMVWGNIIIIKCCNKRYLHQLSLGYTWLYLLYLHCNLYNATYLIWFHQTLALRLVGMAFEVHATYKSKAADSTASTSSTGDIDRLTVEPTAVEIISYSCFFIGLHKGPYYRWKIFNEHFEAPFGVLGDCRIITEQKLKKTFVCGIAYLLLRMKYSAQIYYDKYFYQDYGTDFRFLYNIPLLMMYILKHQITMMLCTSVCTETGFGVYPAKCLPLPGYGPSARHSLLKLAAASPNVALEQEYNFSMLKCFENVKLLIGPKMKDTLRSWNMPTRYWFWAHIFKNLVKANKEVRSACSFLAWTLWCGPSVQQIIISCTLWVYVHLEEEFSLLCNTNGAMKVPWDIGFSIMRMFCLIYLTPCLIIEDADILFKYYNSIFWVYHMVLLVLIIAAVVIYKGKTR